MRYLVTARVKPRCEADLLRAIETAALGRGSVAGDEYLRNMADARLRDDGTSQWVEVCYCATPLAEERQYWEEYFEILRIQDAHPRNGCRDLCGEQAWACSECDCSAELEHRLSNSGRSFLQALRDASEGNR
jgi:hypothetical protein